MTPTLGLFLAIGGLFGLLAAAHAYAITYHKYHHRMLRVDQRPQRMALEAAIVTFIFIMIASVVLYFALRPEGH